MLFGLVIVGVLWGWLWYGVKRRLRRRLVGLSREETDGTFLSRMTTPFDLPALLLDHSERRVRIADMTRGTDDFTMATGNALLCWAFGRLVY